MTYPETIHFLFNSLPVWEQKGVAAYKPGPERVRAFAASLGNPQDRVRTIHVAGTNGKGSVSHMLAAVLQSAGYRTGLFTSPHLVDFRERIRVDGAMIPEAAVVEFTERNRDEMLRLGLTFFEMATVMAYDRFARAGCDAAVIEVGLGGRLDSTNIITPALSVITNIALEHTQYLGATVAAIATEKAGIIKPGVPVVIGETDPESAPVFRARAAELHAPIVFADEDFDSKDCLSADSSNPPDPADADFAPTYSSNPTDADFAPTVAVDSDMVADFARADVSDFKPPDRLSGDVGLKLDLPGDYQKKNVGTVLAAVDILQRGSFDISGDALRNGLQHAAALTGLRGRWDIVGRNPLVVLDTAHNAHGLAEVVRQIARQKYDELFMVLGFAGDKDLGAILPLLPKDARYILTRADTPRAMPAVELKKHFVAADIPARNIEVTETVPEAVRKALASAAAHDMVYIGGSNFVVGEALPLFE